MDHLPCEQAEKEVQKCIRAQRCAAVALARAIKVDILLPYQYAQMEATSFPYRVDFVALVDEASRALDSQTQASLHPLARPAPSMALVTLSNHCSHSQASPASLAKQHIA